MTGSEPDFGWFGGVFRYVRNVSTGSSEASVGWQWNYLPTSSEIPVKYFRTTRRQARNYSPMTLGILLGMFGNVYTIHKIFFLWLLNLFDGDDFNFRY